MSAMPDGNSYYELVTDAGTKPLIPMPVPVDDQPHDEDWKDEQ